MVFCYRGERNREIHYPYLFILVLKILFIQVRCNADILGFTVEGISFKLSAYADDAYYFLKDMASLQVLFQLFYTSKSSHHLKLILISMKHALNTCLGI